MNNEKSAEYIGQGDGIVKQVSVPQMAADDAKNKELEELYQSNDPSLVFTGYSVINPIIPQTSPGKGFAPGTDFERIMEQAHKGIAAAQNDLGLMYMRGNGVEENGEKAVYWLTLAAKQGEPAAMANLGTCYTEGIGVKKSAADALILLSAAELMGIEDAGDYLIDTIDISELSELAEQKSPQAQYFLGICYLVGIKVEQDRPRALGLIKNAAEHGAPLALMLLGECFAKGVYVRKNPQEAERIFNHAIERARIEVGELGIRTVKKKISEVKESVVDDTPYILLKVIPSCDDDAAPKDKYVNDFLDGKLFMKTLDQFGDIGKRDSSSDNNFRGDILEGFAESFATGYNPHLYSQDADGNIEADGILGLIDMLKLREKVFCLAAIEYDESKNCFIRPSAKLRDFGDYAVVITDVDEFLSRVRTAVKKLCEKDNADYWMAYKRVQYGIDMSQQFQYNEFRKSESYSWQKEFRIAIDFSEGKFSSAILDNLTDFAKLTFPGRIEEDTNPRSLEDWFYLEIGDIRKICVCMQTEELVNTSDFAFSVKNPSKRIASFNPKRDPRLTFCKGVTAFQREDGYYNLAISENGFFSALV